MRPAALAVLASIHPVIELSVAAAAAAEDELILTEALRAEVSRFGRASTVGREKAWLLISSSYVSLIVL